ncbi:MAG TPA: hypothetical protein VHO03_07515 [Ignavibacteriales bacterium]|nr:hypothetical protein [Ignavibacteriales bacterium]
MANQLILTIRPGYQGTGIYSGKNEVVTYAELALPDEIKSALEIWISWHRDSFYHPEDFVSDAFEAQGREISRHLKLFLKDSADVTYRGIKIDSGENNLPEAENNEITDLLQKNDAAAKHLSEHLSPVEKVKKAEEIAVRAHYNQPYGDHKENGDYYRYHLDIVRNLSARLAEKHSDQHPYKFEIAALLHDYLEDAGPADEDILNLVRLFGKQTLQSIEKLTYRPDKGHEGYFRAIAEDEVAKIVKTADRIANITALREIKDLKRRKELFQKYALQLEYFERYEIFPDEIEEAIEALLL